MNIVFDYWRVRCNHPRARLDAARGQAIKARLQAGHSVEDLVLAMDGAALDAWVDTKGKRHDKLTLILRDEEHLEDFMERRERAMTHGKLSLLLATFCLPPKMKAAVYSHETSGWGFKCPVCQIGWDRDDYLPLAVNQHAVYCAAGCVAIGHNDVRHAIRELRPRLDDEPAG